MSDPNVTPPGTGLLATLSVLPSQILAKVPGWYMSWFGVVVMTGALLFVWKTYLPEYGPSHVRSLFEAKRVERLAVSDPTVIAKLDALAKRQSDFELQVRAAKGTIDKDLAGLSSIVKDMGALVDAHTARLDDIAKKIAVHRVKTEAIVAKPKGPPAIPPSNPPDPGPVAKISQ